MIYKQKISHSTFSVTHLKEKCRSEIPSDLHQLLLPVDPYQWRLFLIEVRKLRLREEERNYVMELQIRYDLPVRPNESVKATMIRARLGILRKRLKNYGAESGWVLKRILPVDPLE